MVRPFRGDTGEQPNLAALAEPVGGYYTRKPAPGAGQLQQFIRYHKKESECFLSSFYGAQDRISLAIRPKPGGKAFWMIVISPIIRKASLSFVLANDPSATNCGKMESAPCNSLTAGMKVARI
jgi:hypothetical protein